MGSAWEGERLTLEKTGQSGWEEAYGERVMGIEEFTCR